MADEFVFYMAGAAIINILQPSEYKLWLLDHRDRDKVERWQRGKVNPIPANECITLNTKWTPTNLAPDGTVHTVDDIVAENLEPRLEKRLQEDMWSADFNATVTVAVSERLWNPLGRLQPLPPKPYDNQPYRLQLVAQKAPSGEFRYYFGFHAKMIGTGSQHPIIQFFDWNHDKLGVDEVDLASDIFLPYGTRTTLPAKPTIDAEGALFVALDGWKKLPFLEPPKVPWNAGRHGLGWRKRINPNIPKEARDEADDSPRTRRPNNTVANAAPPVAVVSDGQDSWLAAARNTVIDEGTASDQSSIIREISRLLDEHSEHAAIELISHSDDDNLLVFDGWTVHRDAFRNAPRAFKDRLRGRTIRLVGCSTAHGAAARAVLRSLETNLQVTALGTRGLVGLANLGPEGSDVQQRPRLFVGPGPQASRDGDQDSSGLYIIQASDLAPAGDPRPLTEVDREALMSGLASEFRIAVAQILDLVPPVYYAFPGLLRKPSATRRLVPADPGGLPGRIDALYLGQLIRLTRGTWRQSDYIERLFWVPQPDQRAQLLDLVR